MLSRLTTTPVLVAAALTLGVWLAAAPPAAAQDAAAAKKGQEVYNAQKCSICHAIAGKGSKANPLDGVAAKLSAAEITRVDHPPDRGGREGEINEEAADAEQVRLAARGRHRRARRLHAEPQVSGGHDAARSAFRIQLRSSACW